MKAEDVRSYRDRHSVGIEEAKLVIEARVLRTRVSLGEHAKVLDALIDRLYPEDKDRAKK